MIHNLFSKHTDKNSGRSSIFLSLFVVGFLTFFVGVLFLVASAVFSDSSEIFGIVIFFGPFPVVVGGISPSPWLILLAVILTVVSVMLFLVSRREI